MTILTSPDDNFLYDKVLTLLEQIKLVQGGTALASTLRRHKKIKEYCISKQIERLEKIETVYFLDSGELNKFSIADYHQKSTLQN